MLGFSDAILSIQNYGAFFDTRGAGITGPVQLRGLQNGSTADLSSYQWTYQVVDHIISFLRLRIMPKISILVS